MTDDTITIRSTEPEDAAALSALIGSDGVFEDTSQLLTMPEVMYWAENWAGILRTELYKRHGFITEGTLRGHIMRDGVYADTYMMARLHPHPPQMPSPQLPFTKS